MKKISLCKNTCHFICFILLFNPIKYNLHLELQPIVDIGHKKVLSPWGCLTNNVDVLYHKPLEDNNLAWTIVYDEDPSEHLQQHLD